MFSKISERNETGQLRRQNEELRLRLERAVARLEDLDNQSDQHGRVHEKMKDRLKKMDDHAQEQGQQVDIAYTSLTINIFFNSFTLTMNCYGLSGVSF